MQTAQIWPEGFDSNEVVFQLYPHGGTLLKCYRHSFFGFTRHWAVQMARYDWTEEEKDYFFYKQWQDLTRITAYASHTVQYKTSANCNCMWKSNLSLLFFKKKENYHGNSDSGAREKVQTKRKWSLLFIFCQYFSHKRECHRTEPYRYHVRCSHKQIKSWAKSITMTYTTTAHSWPLRDINDVRTSVMDVAQMKDCEICEAEWCVHSHQYYEPLFRVQTRIKDSTVLQTIE